jgi:molybdopterin converting factor small subunit
MAAVIVLIPTPLQNSTEGKKEVELEAGTVRELLDALVEAYPGIKQRIFNEQGEPRRFINIYVGGEDIRFLEGLDTPLVDNNPEDEEKIEVSIVPAIAGG